MTRFALLTHDHPMPHLDLLLEAGEVLRTWRLLAWPRSGETISAEPLPDHRRLYLDYEGPVSGHRGTVARIDGGRCEWIDDHPDLLRVRLTGRERQGLAVLSRQADARWTLTWLAGG
jgi:hypothetical protein